MTVIGDHRRMPVTTCTLVTPNRGVPCDTSDIGVTDRGYTVIFDIDTN